MIPDGCNQDETRLMLIIKHQIWPMGRVKTPKEMKEETWPTENATRTDAWKNFEVFLSDTCRL